MGPDAAGLREIEEIFKRVIQLFAGGAFIALFVMLTWAGIKYITSGGEPKALQPVTQIVTWSLLGMLFLIIAWLVLRLIEAFTQVTVTVFNIRMLCPPCP